MLRKHGMVRVSKNRANKHNRKTRKSEQALRVPHRADPSGGPGRRAWHASQQRGAGVPLSHASWGPQPRLLFLGGGGLFTKSAFSVPRDPDTVHPKVSSPF